MTGPTEAEVAAMVEGAMDRAIKRLQQLHDYAGRPAWDQVLREEISGPINALTAQLATIDTHRRKIILENENLLNAHIDTTAQLAASDAAREAAEARVGELAAAVLKHLTWFERFICDRDELDSSTPRKVSENAKDAAVELRAALKGAKP